MNVKHSFASLVAQHIFGVDVGHFASEREAATGVVSLAHCANNNRVRIERAVRDVATRTIAVDTTPAFLTLALLAVLSQPPLLTVSQRVAF